MHHIMLILLSILFSVPAYARSEGPAPIIELFSHFGLVFGVVLLTYMSVKAARKWQAPVIPFVLSIFAPLLLPVLFFYLAPYLLPPKAQWFIGVGTTLLFLAAALLMRSVISRFRKPNTSKEEPPTVERNAR